MGGGGEEYGDSCFFGAARGAPNVSMADRGRAVAEAQQQLQQLAAALHPELAAVAPAELFPVAAGVAHRGTFVLRVATGPSAAALYVALAYRVAQAAAASAAQVDTHLATEDGEVSEPCREAADMAGLGRARPRFRFVDRLQPVQLLVKLEGPPEVNAAAVEAGVAALLLREPPQPGCSLAVLQCWRGDDDRSKAKLAARAEFPTLPKPVARDAALRAFFSSSPDHRVDLASPEVVLAMVLWRDANERPLVGLALLPGHR